MILFLERMLLELSIFCSSLYLQQRYFVNPLPSQFFLQLHTFFFKYFEVLLIDLFGKTQLVRVKVQKVLKKLNQSNDCYLSTQNIGSYSSKISLVSMCPDKELFKQRVKLAVIFCTVFEIAVNRMLLHVQLSLKVMVKVFFLTSVF